MPDIDIGVLVIGLSGALAAAVVLRKPPIRWRWPIAGALVVIGWLGYLADSLNTPSSPSSYEAVPEGGRVEVAEAGFAITLPDGWVEPFGDVRGTEVLGTEVEPESADLQTALEGLSMWMEDPDSRSGENCQVWVEPDYQLGLDAMAEALMAEVLASWEAEVLAGPEAVPVSVKPPVERRVTLPAGEAVRIDYAQPGLGLQSHHSQYNLVNGTTRYTLFCTASRPPQDYWLSIAETFEFLPIEP